MLIGDMEMLDQRAVTKISSSGLLIFRGKKSKISRDFQGQILRKIGRFHGKFRGETSPRNNQ